MNDKDGISPGAKKFMDNVREMYGGAIEPVAITPRILINSFPKSGTHLAILVTSHLAERQTPQHWVGTFHDNSWSTDWVDVDYTVGIIKAQPPGTWMNGHLGYKPEIDSALREMGTAVIFVYRDLRDVVVSQVYHIENPDDNLYKHPGKAEFMDLGSHEDRIEKVITGLGKYAGIIERWELYAEWVFNDWVYPVRYEDMIGDREGVASGIIDFVLNRSLRDEPGIKMLLTSNIHNAFNYAVDIMGRTDLSSSFRRGKVGSWKEEFTDQHKKIFKKLADDWLIILGYEEDNRW